MKPESVPRQRQPRHTAGRLARLANVPEREAIRESIGMDVTEDRRDLASRQATR